MAPENNKTVKSNWYKAIKEAMSRTDVAGEHVVSEDDILTGAAVRYRGYVFVSPIHAIAWDLAEEYASEAGYGEEIRDLREATAAGIIDREPYEGFMSLKEGFMTRDRALEVANQSKQLKPDVQPGSDYKLQSEDLRYGPIKPHFEANSKTFYRSA